MLSSYSSHAQPLFHDRLDAARQLIQKLSLYKNEDCVVVALPRGGVPIAYQIACSLKAPLFVLSVRKLGSPEQPELAIGAIAADGTIQFNTPLVHNLAINPRQLFDIIEMERERVLARQKQYQAYQSQVDFQNKTVIIVDDGLATGMTMQVAIAAIKKHRPNKIITALPVCAPESLQSIRRQVEDVICLYQPADFISVGLWYRDFTQVSDEEVVALLKSANRQGLPPH